MKHKLESTIVQISFKKLIVKINMVTIQFWAIRSSSIFRQCDDFVKKENGHEKRHIHDCNSLTVLLIMGIHSALLVNNTQNTTYTSKKGGNDCHGTPHHKHTVCCVSSWQPLLLLVKKGVREHIPLAASCHRSGTSIPTATSEAP